MTRYWYSVAALALVAALPLAATAQHAASPPITAALDDSVYHALGGKPGISKIIDDLLKIWQADPRINQALKDADLDRLAAVLKEQITQLAGGPAVYSGRSMKEIHDGMSIRNADFNALAENMQIAMEKNGVPSRIQNKVLAKLAPMQRDIVTK